MTTSLQAVSEALADIRERIIQQSADEAERSALLQAILQLLETMTTMSTGEADDEVLAALQRLDERVAAIGAIMLDLKLTLEA